MASLSDLGNYPILKDKFINFLSGSDSSFSKSLRIFTEMLFGPVALFSLKELIMLSVSSFVIGVRKREFVLKLLRYL